MFYRLVLVRHGQSVYNVDGNFTGWTDVPLTAKGDAEVARAGRLLRSKGFEFDFAFCSVLKRCVKSLHTVLEEADQLWVPEQKSWRLNERHYGELQDLNKATVAAEVGDDTATAWRRSYATQPPAKTCHQDYPFVSTEERPAVVNPQDVPSTESLKDTVDRLLPFWEETIAPAIQAGQQILIVASGNSIRGLVKYIDNISDKDIIDVHIPTGIPMVYELDQNMKATHHYHLEDDSEE